MTDTPQEQPQATHQSEQVDTAPSPTTELPTAELPAEQPVAEQPEPPAEPRPSALRRPLPLWAFLAAAVVAVLALVAVAGVSVGWGTTSAQDHARLVKTQHELARVQKQRDAAQEAASQCAASVGEYQTVADDAKTTIGDIANALSLVFDPAAFQAALAIQQSDLRTFSSDLRVAENSTCTADPSAGSSS